MKKIICYGLVFLVSFFQIGCTESTSNNESDGPNYTHLLIKSMGDSALLISIKRGEEGGIPQYYRLDLQNYTTEIVTSAEGRVFDLQCYKYDEFDLNNFIARNSLNHYSNEAEIGLFQNTYTPLIQDPSASLLYDSIKDNKCIYSIESESSKNDPDDYMDLEDSVYIMNRDGTNKKAIPLGVKAIVTEYKRLTSTIGCIYAHNAGPERLGITALINFETEQVKLFMESGKNYYIEGVTNNAVLMKESDIQANTNRFFLVNADGTEEPDLFHITVKDVYESQYSLMDVQGNRFFYGYIGLDNYYSVCSLNFSTMKLRTILPGKNNADNIESESTLSLFLSPFYIIQESDTLSFILSCHENKVWYLINLDTEEVESIVLPKDTYTTLSTDGKYVLCANIEGRSKKNAIIAFDTQKYTPFSEI